eukprot:5443408-Prymnesium_polylepis.1
MLRSVRGLRAAITVDSSRPRRVTDGDVAQDRRASADDAAVADGRMALGAARGLAGRAERDRVQHVEVAAEDGRAADDDPRRVVEHHA